MEQKIEKFVEKAKQAKSPEEVEAAAKECGLELTEEKLAKLKEALYGKKGELTDGELADEMLDAVAGGKSVIITNILYEDQNHGGMV